VAHSSSSARLTRYCPPTCWAGNPRCLIQRETVDSATASSLVRSRTPSCMLFLPARPRPVRPAHHFWIDRQSPPDGRCRGAAASLPLGNGAPRELRTAPGHLGRSGAVQFLEQVMGRLGGAAPAKLGTTTLVPAKGGNLPQDFAQFLAPLQRGEEQE